MNNLAGKHIMLSVNIDKADALNDCAFYDFADTLIKVVPTYGD